MLFGIQNALQILDIKIGIHIELILNTTIGIMISECPLIIIPHCKDIDITTGYHRLINQALGIRRFSASHPSQASTRMTSLGEGQG